MSIMSTPCIKRLSSDVVDRIAAGEVIQRPQNAVKELIENSLDAGATAIQVTIGMQGTCISMIQVKDNGSGIRKEDLSLACERHCTSKLQSFEDLVRMQTFGFRGEALSSISQVSHVEIVSRTPDSRIGYKMTFDSGRSGGDVVPVAANPGTIVTARDLFYNNSQRKKTLQSGQQEYTLIHELVSLYALNNMSVSFTLMKSGCEPDLKASSESSLTQRIRILMGQKVAANVRDIRISSTSLRFAATGVVGDLRSSLKSYRFVFFVNRRLVECQPLRKSLETVYRNSLPKACCAFVLLSLSIEPENLDVNIHPTKKEVRFLYEDEIIAKITQQLEQVLSESKEENFTTTGSQNALNSSVASVSLKDSASKTPASKSPASSTTPRQSTMIRDDHKTQRIDDSFRRQKAREEVGPATTRRVFKLTSLTELKAAVIHKCDKNLQKIFIDSSVVGCVNSDGPNVLILVQCQKYLLQVDLTAVTEELFYWRTLGLFGNMALMRNEPHISIREMLDLAIKRKNLMHEVTRVQLQQAIDVLMSRSLMLFDYFSMKVEEDGSISSFPILINGYQPDWKKLPDFVYDMVFNVNWKKEKQCFDTMAQALAKFYAVSGNSVDRESITSLIFPEIKSRFHPSDKLQDAILNLSSVPTLYRVFERC